MFELYQQRLGFVQIFECRQSLLVACILFLSLFALFELLGPNQLD